MAHISGITDFLNQAGTNFKVFDMGRRIQEIKADVFLSFEQGEIAYPYPLQQQAWLGMMVWSNSNSDLVIWFLRFPLDTKCLLSSDIRDDFITQLLQKDAKKADSDDNNPYGFKPKQEHMAVFHAKAAKILEQPASHFYSHAQDYFAGTPGFDQWAFVGFQGIADMCSRLDEDKNIADIMQALPQLPPQPFEALCQCLEHEIIPEQLAQVLSQSLDTELNKDQPEPENISFCLRALSGSTNKALCEQQVLNVLTSPQGQDPEILTSISGCCWNTLAQVKIMQAFLETLALCPEGQNFFNLVVVDLINIPGMQAPLHEAIRADNRSAALSKAIGDLFKQFA